MSAKIPVTRTDHTPEDLRALAAQHKYRDCRVRLRAIALIIEDELSRGEIACGVGVDVQTLRDWVVRYNAQGPGWFARCSTLGPSTEAGRAPDCGAGVED